LAAQGLTILLTSSEAEEVLGLADRVFVLSRGKILREFHHGEVTKAELLHAMAGPKAGPKQNNPATFNP